MISFCCILFGGIYWNMTLYLCNLLLKRGVHFVGLCLFPLILIFSLIGSPETTNLSESACKPVSSQYFELYHCILFSWFTSAPKKKTNDSYGINKIQSLIKWLQSCHTRHCVAEYCLGVSIQGILKMTAVAHIQNNVHQLPRRLRVLAVEGIPGHNLF